MMTLLRIGAALALLAAALPDARACSVCACGDPLLGASDPAAISGQLRLQLDTDYLQVTAGNEANPTLTDKLTQFSYRLNAVYRPVEALSLMASVPIVQKELRSSDPADPGSKLTGLGDVELAARYLAWSAVDFGARRSQQLALSAGATLPTGDYRKAGVDMHGQLGTGSFGPTAGVHYRFEQGDWTAMGSLSYRLRTESSLAGGDRYRFGNALLWSVHGQYRAAARLALDLGLDGRDARADQATPAGGARGTVPNTGGTLWSIAPGAYLNATGPFWLFLRAQLPLSQSGLTGVQEVKPSFTAGLQFQLL